MSARLREACGRCNTLRNGKGAPGSGVGADGDFYIDTVAKRIYGPKTAGAWDAGTSMVGPAGAAGANGAAGAPGAPGNPGPPAPRNT